MKIKHNVQHIISMEIDCRTFLTPINFQDCTVVKIKHYNATELYKLLWGVFIMSKTIYQNNDVIISSERQDECEVKINVNGENLIWISLSEEENFKKELAEVLDKYRI